jgi:hypothetical protein
MRAGARDADAHLYASDAALFSQALPPGADLWASDAALYGAAGDARVRHRGADLWASDATLFASAADRAEAKRCAIRGGGRPRAPAAPPAPPRADDGCCAICLGEMETPPPSTASTASPSDPAVTTPCGHRYHARCIVAALDTNRGADDPGEATCPTCRRPLVPPPEETTSAEGRRTP